MQCNFIRVCHVYHKLCPVHAHVRLFYFSLKTALRTKTSARCKTQMCLSFKTFIIINIFHCDECETVERKVASDDYGQTVEIT